MAGRKPAADVDLTTLELTRPQMARLFAVSETTISQWSRAGMPHHARGVFLLGPCLTWWEARLHERGDDRDGSLNATKIKLFDSQRQHAALAMEQRREQLLLADETSAVLTSMFGIVAKHLDGLAARAAAAIGTERDPTRVARLVLGEARQCRRKMAEDVQRFAEALVNDDG